MSTRYSIAQRPPLLNGLFAGVACALTLAVTAGPALAQPSQELTRVQVQGRMVEAPVRYDVRASCAGIERQLQDALQTTWQRERQVGRVNVELVMQGNEIGNVSARGISGSVARSVRSAVRELDCGTQTVADARVYRFRVDFIDPLAMSTSGSRGNDAAMASAQPAVRVAMAND